MWFLERKILSGFKENSAQHGDEEDLLLTAKGNNDSYSLWM